ncbi:Uncharacterised protein [Vibrio cholerae]|nr:Uncharacterised protein [Vibrio cholerae]
MLPWFISARCSINRTIIVIATSTVKRTLVVLVNFSGKSFCLAERCWVFCKCRDSEQRY